MKTISVAIIGCGVIAPTHAAAFSKMPNVKLVYACDVIRERAEKLAEQFSIPLVETDFRKVLAISDIDLVSICLPHFEHARVAIAAIKAGKHVICEKPLARTDRELSLMLAAAEKSKCVCSGIFQHRFEPVNRQLREIVQSGKLGTMLSAHVEVRALRTREYYDADAWRGTFPGEGGSALINQAIHHLDLLSWIMGGASSVSAIAANIAHRDCIETEDTISGAIEWKSGAIGGFNATVASNVSWNVRFTFNGTKGTLEVTDNSVTFASPEELRDLEKFSALDEHCTKGKEYYGGGHMAQIADVVEAISDGREPFVTFMDAAETAHLVLAAYKSAKTGKKVSLL